MLHKTASFNINSADRLQKMKQPVTRSRQEKQVDSLLPEEITVIP